MQFRGVAMIATFLVVTCGALIAPASALAASSTSPNSTSHNGGNPGAPGKTVVDTVAVSNKGIHPLGDPAPLCSQDGCDNKDPISYNCAYSDEVSNLNDLHYQFSNNGHSWDIYMRYSSACKTRWTRLLQVDGGHGACLDRSVTNLIDINISMYQHNSFAEVYGACDGAYTDMGYDPIGFGCCSTSQEEAYYAPLQNNYFILQN